MTSMIGSPISDCSKFLLENLGNVSSLLIGL